MRIHPDGSEAVEAEWLDALRRAGVADVQHVVRTIDGASTTRVGGRVCMVFEWVPGGTLVDDPWPDNARAAGRLCARLHDYPLAERRSVFVGDHVLYFGVADRLGELDPMFREVHRRAQRAVDRLWADPPHPPHLLHGDLGPRNFIVDGERVVAIDFQDLMWGFEVQDVAIAVDVFDVLGLAGDFEAGYRELRAWPVRDEDEFVALIAGRRLLVLNLGLNLRRPGLDVAVARHTQLARAFLDR
jgi:Ser/Thr protein kinase RdoA (MazF antagonist)